MKIENLFIPNLNLIVAMGQNNEIGYQRDLIWRIKEDLEFFKKVTMNSYIIMGRNTYNSMPKKLSGRKYIVLSRDENFVIEPDKLVHQSIGETLNFIDQKPLENFYVIGGGHIYREFLPYIYKMYITQIEDSFEKADVFFPSFNLDQWNKTKENRLYSSEHQVFYEHTLYLRRKN